MVPSTLGPEISVCVRSLNTPFSSSPIALARSSTEGRVFLGWLPFLSWVISGLLEGVESLADAFTASSVSALVLVAWDVLAAAASAWGFFLLSFLLLSDFWDFALLAAGVCSAASRSMCPTMCGPFTSGTTVSTIWLSALRAVLAERFFSWRSCNCSSALLRKLLSALKALFKSSYCLSSSFWLGSLVATGAPFSFKRSVIDCSPTPNSLIALFNLILMQCD